MFSLSYTNPSDIPKEYRSCRLCHRLCQTDRTRQTGYCGMPAGLFAARAALHFWEEPCVSGSAGSGTVFFSGCSLRCIYCQNHSIALGLSGKQLSAGRLSEIFLELQEQGAANINLVTPTHYVPSLLPALDRAKQQGLHIPVVYNTGNYETLDTLKSLDGYIDIYLPDFKYWSSELSLRYSAASDYALYAKENIREMYRQVGKPVFFSPAQPCDDNLTESEACLMKHGLIVRHLLLPGNLEDSKLILNYLYETYQNRIFLSVMNQYTPFPAQLTDCPELNRTVTDEEYDELIDHAINLGVENAFIQEGGTAAESFLPAFDGQGI